MSTNNSAVMALRRRLLLLLLLLLLLSVAAGALLGAITYPAEPRARIFFICSFFHVVEEIVGKRLGLGNNARQRNERCVCLGIGKRLWRCLEHLLRIHERQKRGVMRWNLWHLRHSG